MVDQIIRQLQVPCLPVSLKCLYVNALARQKGHSWKATIEVMQTDTQCTIR